MNSEPTATQATTSATTSTTTSEPTSTTANEPVSSPATPATSAPGSTVPATNPGPGATSLEPGTTTTVELKLPETLPQSVKDMFKVGKFTQEQADGALQVFNTQVAQLRLAEKTDLAKRGSEHVKAWGEAASGNLALAKQALQATDTTGALNKVLVQSGMINSPVVLDYLLGVGKMLREGGFISSTPTAVGQKTAAQKRYPTMKE